MPLIIKVGHFLPDAPPTPQVDSWLINIPTVNPSENSYIFMADEYKTKGPNMEVFREIHAPDDKSFAVEVGAFLPDLLPHDQDTTEFSFVVNGTTVWFSNSMARFHFQKDGENF